MTKCKYLDDLGLKFEEYGTNFCGDDDPRNEYWKEQRETYGFDERETWCMYYQFVQWIYTRMKMFKEINCIDTSYYKFTYKDTIKTQGEWMDYIIELCEKVILMDDDWLPEYHDSIKEICEIWAVIFPAMWW